MRIALVTRELSGVTSYTGGIGIQQAALAQALAHLGHEVHVLTTWDPVEAPAFLPAVTVHRLRRPRLGGLWFVPATRMLRDLGPFEAVCAPEWVGDGWLYARDQAAGPLVTNLATSLEQVLRLSPGWRRPLAMQAKHGVQRRLERRQVEGSSAIISCSRALLDWTQELWDVGDVPAHVVPNAIDVPRTRRLAGHGDPADGFPTGAGPVVLFFGRLEIRKGVGSLVAAMQEVRRRHADAQLVMLGVDTHADDGGWMSDQLRRAAGDGAAHLHLLGPQTPERLFPTVAAADVVALPSRWEAFGLAALETMALGRPAVLTQGSGFSEFCRDGVDGLLVPPDDPDALADAIDRLLDDAQLRASLGASARSRADDFDAPRMAERYTAVLADASGI